MADEDANTLSDARVVIGDFTDDKLILCKPIVDADWERLIKAAEDILKLAGAR